MGSDADGLTVIQKRPAPGLPVRVKGDVDGLGEAVRRERASWRVALVSMPFMSPFRPSIQLGLLKAIGESHGFPVDTFQLNLDFAKQIGLPLYAKLGEHRMQLIGEWLFSVEAFGEQAPDPDGRFLEDFSETVAEVVGEDTESARRRLIELRSEEVPRYLERMLEGVAWELFRVVGFTSTFQQNVASVALARRIKQKFPDVRLVFGGANFEGAMGLEMARSIDVVDYAVIGEGDTAFPGFLIALQEGRDPAQVPGVACLRDGALSYAPQPSPLEAMDELPVPDYRDYFDRAEALGILQQSGRRAVDIPFESARGCWWGAKKHCTFCGLNGATMKFRSKSPARLSAELAELARRYRSFQFEAVDNILDHSYLKTFLPELSSGAGDYTLFYEVKANFSREQVRALRQAGVARIQPGIESLSSHVLSLMRKGVLAVQNVNTMRWALYYGIDVAWNLIWGFPGETAHDYAQQARLFPHLLHLQPPGGWGPIWMERFSPIFTDRKSFPARYVRPEASYGYVYPKHANLDDLAYFFDYEFEQALPPEAYEGMKKQAAEWLRLWKKGPRPRLTFWYSPELLQIEDARDPESPGSYNFPQPLASLYVTCSDQPRTAAALQKRLQLDAPLEEIEEALDEFCARGLMMRDGDHFLSLALPATTGR